MWIFQTNFAKFVFLIRYDHWSFSSIVSAVSLWPYKDFLKCLAPTRGKIDPVSLNPLLAGKSFLKSPVSNEIVELKFFIPSRLQVLFLKNYFIYLWLRWVFVAVRRLSLVAASRGYSSLWFTGFSLRWLLLLRSMGSRHAGFSSCGTRASVCGTRAQ